MREERLGELDAVMTGGTDRNGGGDGPVVVLLHGFGAPGHDLVPLWRVLDVPRNVRFVFPAAPRALPGFGDARAWWMIDLSRFESMQRTGSARPDMSNEEPPGMAEARAQLLGLLDEVEHRLGARKIVLGGFSQGAMLAVDVALRSDRWLAGLAVMSGTLLARDIWTRGLAARQGLPVLQSHGQQDPLLDFAQAEALRDLFVDGGLEVEWMPFRGGHEIPDKVVERLGALITVVTS